MFDFAPAFALLDDDTLLERLAVSILSNLETNVHCRTSMFEKQIQIGYQHFRAAMAPDLAVANVFAEKEEMQRRRLMARGSTQRLLSSEVRSMWDSRARSDSSLRYDDGRFGPPFNKAPGLFTTISALTSRPSSPRRPEGQSAHRGRLERRRRGGGTGENPWKPNIAGIRVVRDPTEGEEEEDGGGGRRGGGGGRTGREGEQRNGRGTGGDAARSPTSPVPKNIEVTLALDESFTFRGSKPQVPEPLPDNYDQVPADKKLVRKLQRKRNRLFKWKHTLGTRGARQGCDGVFEAVPSDAADEENFWLSQNVPSCPTNFGSSANPAAP